MSGLARRAPAQQPAEEVEPFDTRQQEQQATGMGLDDGTWYDEFVAPAAVTATGRRGLDLAADDDPDTPAQLLRLLRAESDQPDIAALLDGCRNGWVEADDAAAPDAVLLGEEASALFDAMKALLVEELGLDPGIQAMAAIDIEALDPRAKLMLGMLDENADDRLDASDVQALCEGDEALSGLLLAVAGSRSEISGDDASTVASAAGYASRAAQGPGNMVYGNYRAAWNMGAHDQAREYATRVEGQYLELYVAAVFLKHLPTLPGTLAQAQQQLAAEQGSFTALQSALLDTALEEASRLDLGVMPEETGPGRVTLVVEDGAQATDGNLWLYHDQIRVDRAYMGTRNIREGIRHAVRLGYRVQLELNRMSDEATHEVRMALDDYGTQVDRILLHGVEVTGYEYEQLYLHFAGGEHSSYARDMRSGEVYDAASTEGRLRRDRDIGILGSSPERPAPEQANPLVAFHRGDDPVLDSTLGRMRGGNVTRALELIRSDDSDHRMRMERAAMTDDRPVASDDDRFRGKTLRQVAELLYAEIDYLAGICTQQIESAQAHAEPHRAELQNLRKEEITRTNFDAIACRVHNLRLRLGVLLETVILPYGMDASEVAARAAENMGDVDSLNDLCRPVGWLIDSVAPDDGDKGKFQFNFNVPLEQSGSLRLGGEFVAEVERDSAGVKLRLQAGMKLSGNMDMKIAKLFLEANFYGYVTGYGDRGEEAMRLALLPLQQEAADIDEELEAALFDPDWLPSVMSEMDADDYGEGGTGFSVAGGMSVGDNGGSVKAGQSEGTRYTARGDYLDHQDIVSSMFSVKVAVGDLEIEVKLSGKEVDYRFDSWAIEGEAQYASAINELSNAGRIAHIVSGLIGGVRSAYADHGGLLDASIDPDIRAGLGLAADAGGDQVGAQVAQQWLAAKEQLSRPAGGQFGVRSDGSGVGAAKVGHKFGIKLAGGPGKPTTCEVAVERMTSIEFGSGPRDYVYILLEDVDPVITIPLF